MTKFTCIDLFSGCGGLTLGMQRAGFEVLAAVDHDQAAVKVLSRNCPDIPHVLQADLAKFAPRDLAARIGRDHVDVIVGGPPCQGFSMARQRDGANSGPRMVRDKRRQLYQEFLRFVHYFQPNVFVMENVPGIKSAAGGRYLTGVQHGARLIGYRVHAQTEKVFSLGVPQKRVRQLIIGTRLDLPILFSGKMPRAPRATERPTLGEAIGDLPVQRAGSGSDDAEYDLDRRQAHIAKYGTGYLLGVLEADRATRLTAHVARPHSQRDLRDFARLKEGEHSGLAVQRGVKFEFPYDKEAFWDRYTRQHRDRLCSTIVAHMAKDGLMFIHPTQNRSLTPREAARVQSFPDWFVFPVSRTHQFRLIGNAVPPLVGEALGLAVKSYLERSTMDDRMLLADYVPSTESEAAERLVAILDVAERKSLHRLSLDRFRRGWAAIAFLYPEIHPDSAREHGTQISKARRPRLPGVSPDRRRQRVLEYVQSGWPVAFEPVAREALRRYRRGQLSEDEFYCSQALVAAMRERRSTQAAEVSCEQQKASA
jgi:DNA (cytosine-5)-methyltransferase 1